MSSSLLSSLFFYHYLLFRQFFFVLQIGEYLQFNTALTQPTCLIRQTAGTKVPDFLVVSIKAIKTDDFSEWTVNALEDHAAAAAAVQNFMVSCASQGVATKWMTGKMGIAGSDILTKCCGVEDISTEHYMGTLLVGKPQVAMSSMKVPERKQGLSEPVFEVTA